MGKIEIIETEIPDVKIVVPQVFSDGRGSFSETYSERDYFAAGIETAFVQENQSWSVYGTLRGLHFQKTKPQAKLVRVAYGAAFDVAVDLREGKTFGKWIGVELSESNGKQLFIPKGFAHGFLALSERVCFSYKVSDYYCPTDEGGIAYDDREIGIQWPKIGGRYALKEYILSEKDKKWGSLAQWKEKR